MQTGPQNTIANRRPRWLRYSLRTLLLLMTLLCICLGLHVNPARRQREAVAAILKVDGDITFDYQLVPIAGRKPPNNWDYDPNALPPGPAWLRAFLGEEYFRDVVEVRFPAIRFIPESSLRLLANLPKLRSIAFYNAMIDRDSPGRRRSIIDADLEVFSRLNQLERIDISYGDITGPGLAYITDLQHLRTLVLDCPIDEAGMRQIGKMTNLTRLSIGGKGITDVGLKHVQNLTKLEELGLTDTAISDAGLVYLDSIPIQKLVLRNTHIGDPGMEQIGKMTDLTRLELNGTNVSDAGLEHLKGLTKLTDLYLQRTKVTAYGIRELQKSLPNATIVGP